MRKQASFEVTSESNQGVIPEIAICVPIDSNFRKEVVCPKMFFINIVERTSTIRYDMLETILDDLSKIFALTFLVVNNPC